MVAALSKAGSTFSVGEARTYDAWGQVRSQVGTDGKLRYCANLGHKQDDESGLIYMRARYYEPSSGRFLSEDVQRDGTNFYTYANCDPIQFIDQNGGVAENLLFDGLRNWTSGLMKSMMARGIGPILIWLIIMLAGPGERMMGSRGLSAGLQVSLQMGAVWQAEVGTPVRGGLRENIIGFYEAWTGTLQLALYVILNDYI